MPLTTIPDHLDHWLGRHPDKRFAAFLDLHGNVVESHSYRTFDRRSRSLAERLHRDAGLRPGDRALLVHAPGLELVAAFVACARLGVIPAIAPPPRSPESRLRLLRMIGDCGARVVLTDARSCDAVAAALAAGPPVTIIDTGTLPDSDRPACPEARSDLLFLQYTSGSTGDPRGVMVSHANVIHNCAVTAHADAVGVSWLPQFHDMGMIGFYLFLIVTGGTTYGFSPADFLRRPVLWLETISRYRGTITSSPNFGFDYCASPRRVPEEALAGIDLASVRVFMNGAEQVDPATYRRFHARFAPLGLAAGAHAAGYGLAENTLAVSFGGEGRSVSLDRRALREGRLLPAPDGMEVMSCGRPLSGIRVRIVAPETGADLGEDRIGEVWIGGPSTCRGYWNRPGLSRRTFANRIAGEPPEAAGYLRSGDLGFLRGGELHICGRIKDIVILRGRNFLAHDLESAVIAACPGLRADAIAAFQEGGAGGALVIAIGTGSAAGAPDLGAVLRALRAHGYDGAVRIALLPPQAIIRTSSGKLARGRLRDRWMAEEIPVLASLFDPGGAEEGEPSLEARYLRILNAHSLRGDEPQTMGEAGLDSLALVELVMALEAAAEAAGVPALKTALDGPLVQGLAIADLTQMVRRLAEAEPGSLRDLHALLVEQADRQAAAVRLAMRRDAVPAPAAAGPAPQGPQAQILLTGGTGFLGPFLLAGLLDNGAARIRVLVRAADPAAGRERLAQSLIAAGFAERRIAAWLGARVEPVCGDLSRPRLGLDEAAWTALSLQADSIVHSAAMVDYALPYDAMRAVNVEATREILRLAFAGRPKRFHHVSSTIVFGWSAREKLIETEANDGMAELDFGYAQSKWVAERLVLGARDAGLDARIYRPSFVTASTGGVGDRSDIVIRLLAFMINHGIAPRTVNQVSFLPVDIAAHNMARIIAHPGFANATFHATVGDYYNLMDVTAVIARDYGVRFRYMEIEDFVRRMRALCTERDLAYPLLDFITRARNKFAAMRDKRYSNAVYRRALAAAGGARPDPDLGVTVAGIIEYMRREGLIGPEIATGARPEARARSLRIRHP